MHIYPFSNPEAEGCGKKKEEEHCKYTREEKYKSDMEIRKWFGILNAKLVSMFYE
jgi:hypothetical protein